jgi:aminoglycoside phosphotransferase (APT) family kinase protein
MIVYPAVLSDTREVRGSEQLNWPALAKYLRWELADRSIPGLDLARDMEVSQFPGGHSNLTYLLKFGGAELVLRRPPLGPVAPKAHDMAREYRWLSAVHPIFPLAPRPYLLCEDPAVVGSVFYVMERRRGIVVRQDEPIGLAHRPEVRRRLSESLIDTLVTLHAVDVTREAIAQLGKPAGFVERQVRGWTSRWEGSRTDDVPEMETLAKWLLDHLPAEPDVPTIVHGDYKLDNILLDALDVSRPIAIFDWEMSALGDPLVDLALLLVYWKPTVPPALRDGQTYVTENDGYLTKDQLVERYATQSGRDLSNIRYYETFAVFKLAVIIQQIYSRYVKKQTDDPRFARFGERVAYLAREAVRGL